MGPVGQSLETACYRIIPACLHPTQPTQWEDEMNFAPRLRHRKQRLC